MKYDKNKLFKNHMNKKEKKNNFFSPETFLWNRLSRQSFLPPVLKS